MQLVVDYVSGDLSISSNRLLGILLGQKLIGQVKVVHEPFASGYL